MPARALLELRSLVIDEAARFEARTLDREGAAEAMRCWATIVHAAEAGLAMASARVAECDPPASAGASSAADFVAKQTGITANKATEKIKAGEGLQSHNELRSQATRDDCRPTRPRRSQTRWCSRPRRSGSCSTRRTGRRSERCARSAP